MNISVNKSRPHTPGQEPNMSNRIKRLTASAGLVVTLAAGAVMMIPSGALAAVPCRYSGTERPLVPTIGGMGPTIRVPSESLVDRVEVATPERDDGAHRGRVRVTDGDAVPTRISLTPGGTP